MVYQRSEIKFDTRGKGESGGVEERRESSRVELSRFS